MEGFTQGVGNDGIGWLSRVSESRPQGAVRESVIAFEFGERTALFSKQGVNVGTIGVAGNHCNFSVQAASLGGGFIFTRICHVRGKECPDMMKKSTTTSRKSAYTAESFAHGKKRLELKQIRGFVEKLVALPDDAPLPDWSELSIGDRFAVVRRLVPADQREEVTGKSDSQHQRYEQGGDIPLTVVAALAAETEIPLEWIVSGKAMDRRASRVQVVPPEQPAADSDDVPIQKLAFKASAGTGAMVLEEIGEHVRFPRAILAHAGVVPQSARLLEASGESMRSTINDGDTLLVDVSTAAIQIVEGKIYVFSVGDDAYVKRLRRLGEQVLMISDNREMFPEPEEVPKHLPLRVYGRVKWAGRNL